MNASPDTTDTTDIPIRFHTVTFAYPAEAGDPAESEEPAAERAEDLPPVFSSLSLALPAGFTFLVGPNGIGKSTLMLLAAARLFPQRGEVTLLGAPTTVFVDAAIDAELEERRNRLVSFVYQNMEFETEATIGELFEVVGMNSVDPRRAAEILSELLVTADLTERRTARMQELSKGEMQRAIIVMSILYGSPIVVMDEPVFAVEPARAEKLFEYLKTSCSTGNTTIYTSVHDVTLARRFADAVILMHADGLIEAGSPEELLSRDRLEQAFKAPWDTLYKRQSLYREFLNKS